MRLEIDDSSLHELLQSKKEYIGNSYLSGSINIIGGMSFGVTLFSANIATQWLNIVLWIAVIAWILIGLIQVVKTIQSHGYNYEKLYGEIKDLSISKKSLVAIMNDFEGDNANKVLLKYYPIGWETYMFLSYRTAYQDDEENVISRVAASLKIDRKKIEVQFLTENPNQPKYSPKHKKIRRYQNRYYQVFIKEFPEFLKKDCFEKDDQKYKWMTLEEIEKDEKIQENNSDVVRVFEQYIFNTAFQDNRRSELKSPFPKNVCVRLNRKCNLSCSFCLACHESVGLTTEQVKKVLMTLKNNGVTRARLAGGEPTLRGDIIEIIDYCVKQGFETVVYSNLIDIDELFDKLVQYPISIATSLHGTREFHDSVTKKGAYDITRANIVRLIQASIPVSLHMVLMDKNVTMVEGVIKDAIQIGVRKVSIQTLIPRGKGDSYFQNGESEFIIRENLRKFEYLKEKYRGIIKVHLIDLYEKNYYVLETDGGLYLEKHDNGHDEFIRSLL